MAEIDHDATAEVIDIALEEVCQETSHTITSDIIYSSDNYNLRAIQGALI